MFPITNYFGTNLKFKLIYDFIFGKCLKTLKNENYQNFFLLQILSVMRLLGTTE